VLAGYDQKSNVVLSDSKERVYSIDEGVEEVPLGLYLVKGDMMCVARSFPLCPHPLRPPPLRTVYNRYRHMPRFLPTQKSRHVLIIPSQHSHRRDRRGT